MHILQLLPTLNVGGVERGVADLAKGLIRRGHRVSVVSAGGPLVQAVCAAGAMHYTLPVDRKSPVSMAAMMPAVAQLIRDTGIELVHARSRVPGWIGYAAARWTQRPFLTTCHGFYAPHAASRVMTWGRTVIVPSHVLGRYLIDQFHVPPERLCVIPRGVDLSEFPRRAPHAHGEGPWRLGVIGRPSPLKGHEVAIRALHQLVSRGLSVRLVLVGAATEPPTKLMQRLEQLARTLDVSRSIEWLPIQREIPACLASLDAILVPSTYPESFGRSVIEAQAVGVPVIASRIGALGEIVEDGVTGVLVPPRDPSALARAIERLLGDEALRQRCSDQARRRVEERYSLDQMVERTETVYREALTKPRVVVWKLSAAGDVVLASPSLRAIRRRFPESTIRLVVGRRVQALVSRCPHVDEVLVLDESAKAGPACLTWFGAGRRWWGRWRLLKRLRRAQADLSIDLHNSRLTHALAWLARIPVRVGYARRWGRLLNRAVPLPQMPMHPIAHQQQVLGAADVRSDGDALEVWPSEEDRQRAEHLLASAAPDAARPLIGLHPGASPRWKTKRWPVERWAALCDRLNTYGAQVILTGSAEEQPLAEAIRSAANPPPVSLMGQTSWLDLACLIRRCRVFVTGDSAPLHLAAAVGTPTVALFGPTDPARHVPRGATVQVMRHLVPCSPCYSTWCKTITHACMKQITVEEVYAATAALCDACASSSSPRT